MFTAMIFILSAIIIPVSFSSLVLHLIKDKSYWFDLAEEMKTEEEKEILRDFRVLVLAETYSKLNKV